MRNSECGMKKTAILYITENGLKLAVRLRSVFPDAEIVRYDPGLVPSLWADHAALVFIMASGIVVRTIEQSPTSIHKSGLWHAVPSPTGADAQEPVAESQVAI